jgi:hypothetical protein
MTDEERERQRKIAELPMTLTSFDQLNVLQDGLGDKLRDAFLVRADSDQVEIIPIPPKADPYEIYTPGCFSGCKFCGGNGCAACDGEFQKARKQSPV